MKTMNELMTAIETMCGDNTPYVLKEIEDSIRYYERKLGKGLPEDEMNYWYKDVLEDADHYNKHLPGHCYE